MDRRDGRHVTEDTAQAGDALRVAELLRVNRELASEIRHLTRERVAEPRPSQLPAARRITRLVNERDSLLAELKVARADLQSVSAGRDELLHQRDALEGEVTRLRSGFTGLLRRARARLLRN